MSTTTDSTDGDRSEQEGAYAVDPIEDEQPMDADPSGIRAGGGVSAGAEAGAGARAGAGIILPSFRIALLQALRSLSPSKGGRILSETATSTAARANSVIQALISYIADKPRGNFNSTTTLKTLWVQLKVTLPKKGSLFENAIKNILYEQFTIMILIDYVLFGSKPNDILTGFIGHIKDFIVLPQQLIGVVTVEEWQAFFTEKIQCVKCPWEKLVIRTDALTAPEIEERKNQTDRSLVLCLNTELKVLAGLLKAFITAVGPAAAGGDDAFPPPPPPPPPPPRGDDDDGDEYGVGNKRSIGPSGGGSSKRSIGGGHAGSGREIDAASVPDDTAIESCFDALSLEPDADDDIGTKNPNPVFKDGKSSFEDSLALNSRILQQVLSENSVPCPVYGMHDFEWVAHGPRRYSILAFTIGPIDNGCLQCTRCASRDQKSPCHLNVVDTKLEWGPWLRQQMADGTWSSVLDSMGYDFGVDTSNVWSSLLDKDPASSLKMAQSLSTTADAGAATSDTIASTDAKSPAGLSIVIESSVVRDRKAAAEMLKAKIEQEYANSQYLGPHESYFKPSGPGAVKVNFAGLKFSFMPRPEGQGHQVCRHCNNRVESGGQCPENILFRACTWGDWRLMAMTTIAPDGTKTLWEKELEHLGYREEDKKADHDTPVTIAEIDSLPVTKLTDPLSPDEDMCSICFSKMEVGEDVKRLPCLHCFHSECASQSLRQTGPSCPNCRRSIRNSEAPSPSADAEFTTAATEA